MDKALKTATLAALGLFLYTRVLNETIVFYIHERFTLLTLLGAVTLLLIAAGYIFHPAHEDHTHDHAHDHDHAVSWWGLLIVALPVVVGLLVPPQPLGAVALLNRTLNLGDWEADPLAAANSGAASSRAGRSAVPFPQIPPLRPESNNAAAGEATPINWPTFLQQMTTPAALQDKEGELTGFVYRDGRFANNRFLLGRFVVSCCVADAMALGVVVEWPEAADFPADEWVTVHGRFQMGEFDGRSLPILIADRVQSTETPEQPYFYR